MKLSIQSLSKIFLVCGCFFQGATSFAQTSSSETKSGNSSLKIAYVDMQAAILQTDDGKAAKRTIELEAEGKRGALLKQEQELKKLDDEFQLQSAVLSETERNAKQKDLATKFHSFQQGQMAFEKEVRKKEMEVTGTIFQKLAKIVEEESKAGGYTLVFERGSGALLYAAKIDDLTPRVVRRYNEKHSDSSKKSKDKK